MGKRGPQPKPKTGPKKPSIKGGAKKDKVVRQIQRDFIEKYRGQYTLTGLAREVNLTKAVTQKVIDEIESSIVKSPPQIVPPKADEVRGARKAGGDLDLPLPPQISPDGHKVAFLDEEMSKRLNKMMGQPDFKEVTDQENVAYLRTIEGVKCDQEKKEQQRNRFKLRRSKVR